jgi:hypothetical protein
MNKLILAFALFMSVILVSCQQEVDPDLITTPNNPNNGNTADSYQPLTAGSFWKYKDSASGGLSTLTATSVSKIINGRTFTGVLAANAASTDSVWMASPKPDYFYQVKGFSPNTGAPYNLLFHYLNDTAAVGYEWEYPAGQGNGFAATIHTTIEEKGLTVTIAGKTYTNVIHTSMELSYDITGMVGVYDFYVAKGVGIIRIRFEMDTFGFTTTTCSDLIDYHIQ